MLSVYGGGGGSVFPPVYSGLGGRPGRRWTTNPFSGVMPAESSTRWTFALLLAFRFFLRSTPATRMANVAAAETIPMLVDENTLPEVDAATTGAGEASRGLGVPMVVWPTSVGDGDFSSCDGEVGSADAGEVVVGDEPVGRDGASRTVGDRVGERAVVIGTFVKEPVPEISVAVGEGVAESLVSSIRADKSNPPTVPVLQDPVVGPAKSIWSLSPGAMITALSSSASDDPPCRSTRKNWRDG